MGNHTFRGRRSRGRRKSMAQKTTATLLFLLIAFCATSVSGTCPELEGSYEATLAELSNSSVVGKVTVHRKLDADDGHLQLAVGGYATGLSGNCNKCSVSNCCGFHIHSGESCDDSTTQGGHLKNPDDTDPWAPIKINTDDADSTEQTFAQIIDVAEDYDPFEGKVFIVHDVDGNRVSCGPLVRVDTTAYKTNIARFSASTSDENITGSAEVKVGTFAALTCVSLDGYTNGASCEDEGKCGVHVHSGTSCTDKTTQGDHYPSDAAGDDKLPKLPREDPWHNNVLTKVSMDGLNDFGWGVIMTGSDYTDVEGKAFVVHDSVENDRASCGVLEAVPVPDQGDGTSGSATLWSGLAVTAATLIAYFAG